MALESRAPAASRMWRSGASRPAGDEPVEHEQDDRADHRHDEANGIPRLIEADRATEPSSEHGPHDSQHRGQDEAARVAARHQELGDDSHDESEDDPDDDAHWRHLLRG